MRHKSCPRVRSLEFLFFVPLLFLADLQNQGTANANTSENTSDICVSAAQIAATKTGVPLAVLIAITLTETGRSTETGFKSWPWAVNQAGKGYWFDKREDAVQFAEDQLDLGLRNFDVGCFQLNHRWHSKGFRSTTDMFDPVINAIYAAEFLSDLYTEKGDWSLAAAAYHSRTPEQADRYQAKYEKIYANLGDTSLFESNDTTPVIRVNWFPLLQAGLKGNSGSIVPKISTVTPLIGNYP